MKLRRWMIPHMVALLLALTTLGALRQASQSTGYVRDEAAYFAASLKIRNWLNLFVQDPSKAVERKDQAFGYNREHPAGIKLIGALAAFDISKGKIPGQQLRLPAQLVTALGVYLLAIVGISRYGIAIGAFCAAAFIALPRVFFHAQLHCFDIPIAVAALGVSVAFVRFAQHPSYLNCLILGGSFGLSLSVKHNALLFPAFILAAFAWHAIHAGLTRALWTRIMLLGLAAIGVGAVCFVALWPWLWTDTISRWLEYLAFHREHSYYNMAFLGQNYNQPPLPIAYPWVLTAVTWPLSWLLLVIAGLGLALRKNGSTNSLAARVDVVMALGPIVLISLPSIPIFGGTKHWITAYPFCCLLMGRALAALFNRMQLQAQGTRLALAQAGLVLLLSPAIIDTWRSHPHQLAQYAGWMGGPRAAARMGLGRAFWGSMCVPQALDQLDAPGELFGHDMHPYLLGAYQTDGRAPGITSASRRNAKWALHFYEDHFLIDEIWTQRADFGLAPSWVCDLDDVPLMSLYRKGEVGGS